LTLRAAQNVETSAAIYSVGTCPSVHPAAGGTHGHAGFHWADARSQ